MSKDPFELPEGISNEQQYKFCHLYAYSEKRGNGVLCYAEAYDIDLTEQGAYNGAKSNAYRLLTNDYILSYIRSLYEQTDLNDTVVDNELAFVIKQNADFGSKVAGIKEYNQLKGRIIKKIDQQTNSSTVTELNPTQFAELLSAANKNAQSTSSQGE